MGERITGEQVKRAAIDAGIDRVDHHDCSLCGEMVFYSIDNGDLYFNSGCGCSWSPPQPRSWSDAADWINMQSDDGRERLMARFGFQKFMTPRPLIDRMAEALRDIVEMIDNCADVPRNPDSLPMMVLHHARRAVAEYDSQKDNSNG